MEKINLDKYFAKSDIESKVRVLDSPEDIAEAERVNKEMRIICRRARAMFARSAELARHFYFTR